MRPMLTFRIRVAERWISGSLSGALGEWQRDCAWFSSGRHGAVLDVQGSGKAIARHSLKSVWGRPKSRVCGFAGARRRAAAMDVDRISAMGGVGHEGSPLWNREKMRRRKFVEEVEPSESEVEELEEAAAADYSLGDENSARVLNVMA